MFENPNATDMIVFAAAEVLFSIVTDMIVFVAAEVSVPIVTDMIVFVAIKFSVSIVIDMIVFVATEVRISIVTDIIVFVAAEVSFSINKQKILNNDAKSTNDFSFKHEKQNFGEKNIMTSFVKNENVRVIIVIPDNETMKTINIVKKNTFIFVLKFAFITIQN